MSTPLSFTRFSWLAALAFCAHALTVRANTYSPTILNDPVISSEANVNSATGVISGGPGDGQVSLRSAIIAANHNPGADMIQLQPGTYTLSIPGNVTTTQGSGEGFTSNALIGDLDVTDTGTTLLGAGMNSTTILQGTPGNGSFDRVLEINPNLLSNFDFTVQDLTITGGNTPDGGGGMVAGSANNHLTINNVRFTQNRAFGSGSGGGALLFIGGGTLVIMGSVFDSNSTDSSSGGAIDFLANPAPGSFAIQRSVFDSNSANSGGDGGAIRVGGNLGASSTITLSSFSANSGGGSGGALSVQSLGSSVTVSLSRFSGNSAALAANGKTIAISGSSVVTANDNWWGANTGPAANDIPGSAPVTWLQLRLSFGASSVSPGSSAVLTADILGRNSGGPLASGALDGLPAFPASGSVFGAVSLGSLSGAGTQFVNGGATATFNAGNVAGTGSVQATDDSQVITTSVNIPTSVSSITRVGVSPTSASSVQWDVTLANPVDALLPGNFAFTGAGVTASISSLSPTTATPSATWRITASITGGHGTLGLNMANDTGASAHISNLPFTGGAYDINAPPVPGDDAITRLPGKSTKVSIAQLLSNDTDPDDPGTLTLSLPSATSANGAGLSIEGGWVLYDATPSDAPDSFQYTVTDARGASATGTVTVTIQADNSQSKNSLSISTEGTDKVLRFAGIPGISYDIQYTDDLNSPSWTTLGSALAGPDGVVQFRDVNPPSLSRYYRTFTP